MPRAATTSDVFNAIAEPRRREIIDLLRNDYTGDDAGGVPAAEEEGGWPVGAIVRELRLPQPAVSKHLGVLRSVRIVTVSRRGRSRVYRLNAKELKPVYDWTKIFEQYWTQHVDRIKERAEQKARERLAAQNNSHPQKEK